MTPARARPAHETTMSLSRRHSSDVAIAPALTDVLVAAQRVVTDRVDLTRMMVRADARELLVVAAYGTAAAVASAVALLSAAGTLIWLIMLWAPLGAALGTVAVLCLAAAAWLFHAARRHLPTEDAVPRALTGQATPSSEAVVRR